MVTSLKKSPTKPESLSLEKCTVRLSLKKSRAAILPERTVEASDSLLHLFKDLLLPFPRILSFASFGTEIDTAPLNRLLAKRGQLFLPKIAGNDLQIFHLSDLNRQLAPNSLGILEPIVDRCERVAPDQLSLILVPALGFDRHHTHRDSRIGNFANPGDPDLKPAKQPISAGDMGDTAGFKDGDAGAPKNSSIELRCVYHRIGYGKGFYDRLLQSLPLCPTYGIGFTEQLIDRLPISDQDIALSELFLF
ncbi:MAG: hypothetical protein K1000chlam4_00057 [Chlamydiae bacterium]|nr:hypothetical protein [Chlamydiota bacterium]